MRGRRDRGGRVRTPTPTQESQNKCPGISWNFGTISAPSISLAKPSPLFITKHFSIRLPCQSAVRQKRTHFLNRQFLESFLVPGAAARDPRGKSGPYSTGWGRRGRKKKKLRTWNEKGEREEAEILTAPGGKKTLERNFKPRGLWPIWRP